MTDEDLADRIAAVERRLDAAYPEAPDRVDQERVEAMADRLAELEAAVEAIEGYVGEVERVDDELERRADAALAATDDLEARVAELEATAGGDGAPPQPASPQCDDAARGVLGPDADDVHPVDVCTAHDEDSDEAAPHGRDSFDESDGWTVDARTDGPNARGETDHTPAADQRRSASRDARDRSAATEQRSRDAVAGSDAAVSGAAGPTAAATATAEPPAQAAETSSRQRVDGARNRAAADRRPLDLGSADGSAGDERQSGPPTEERPPDAAVSVSSGSQGQTPSERVASVSGWDEQRANSDAPGAADADRRSRPSQTGASGADTADADAPTAGAGSPTDAAPAGVASSRNDAWADGPRPDRSVTDSGPDRDDVGQTLLDRLRELL